VEALGRRRQRIGQRVAAGKAYAGNAISNQNRGSRQVKAIENTRGEEVGDRAAATLNQDSTEITIPQHIEQCLRGNPAG
jgi:chorismate mutase